LYIAVVLLWLRLAEGVALALTGMTVIS
jgi:hypothetical protein